MQRKKFNRNWLFPHSQPIGLRNMLNKGYQLKKDALHTN